MRTYQATVLSAFRSKRSCMIAVFLLSCMASGSSVFAADAKLTKGADVIEFPAVGEGLCVHNLFQSNMVLQRDKPVKVWGWAEPGETVTVSFADQELTATAGKDRRWAVALLAMGANNKAQTMTIKGKEATLILENILVGDVWILGGQSNMEFPLSRIEHGDLEIVSANYDGIRILTIPKQKGAEVRHGFPRLHEWSGWFGRHYRKGDWDVCSPEIARELSAIGYVFARRIHMASKIPIGVIDASVGGTTVETWTPVSVLKSIDSPEVKAKLSDWETKVAEFDPQKDLESRIQKHRSWLASMKKRGQAVPADRVALPTDLRPGPAWDQNRPGNCYNNLLSPIAGFSVKGAIFHQGYNNALGAGSAGAKMYHDIFGEMITAWRATFNDPNMPFGIISLCTAGDAQTRENYLEMMVNDGIYIREAQYKTFLDFLKAGDEQIGFASSFDMRRVWYHPREKVPVGERIARWALATQYGQEKMIKWRPPMLKEMKVESDRLVLHFDTRVLTPGRVPMVGFAIAGADRRFQPAEADWLEIGKDSKGRPRLEKQALVLSSPHVPKPIHFRYAWGRNPMGNLKSDDNAMAPFATQRSDDWKAEEVPVKVREKEMEARELKRTIQRELRLEDMERRLKDAQAFIDEYKEKIEQERAKLK